MRVITVARKPLSESSVAANVLKHDTGAINIDATRIGTGEDKGIWPVTDRDCRTTYSAALTHSLTDAVETDTTKGRWPANMILQHLDGCCLGEGWECAPGCPVADLDQQSGVTTNTSHHSYRRGGGAFIDGIASQPERDRWVTETGTASRYFKQVGGSDGDE